MDEKGAKQAGLRDKTHVERRPVLQALDVAQGPEDTSQGTTVQLQRARDVTSLTASSPVDARGDASVSQSSREGHTASDQDLRDAGPDGSFVPRTGALQECPMCFEQKRLFQITKVSRSPFHSECSQTVHFICQGFMWNVCTCPSANQSR
jgi:hypothetical protein